MRKLLAVGASSYARWYSSSPPASQIQQSGHGWKFWVPVGLLGGFATGASAWLATSEHPSSSAKLVVQFPLRLARDIVTAGTIVAGEQRKFALLCIFPLHDQMKSI